jgi:hypothetical protein
MQKYIKQKDRSKILLLCDDIRFNSGIATMAREIVTGTAHHYNWVNIGGAIEHEDNGKVLDLSEDTNKISNITDSYIKLYPVTGYGTIELVRGIINIEKPDAIMLFTDPRYWAWLFEHEHEIRQSIPIIYLSIWDDLPYPLYNAPYYESCDSLLGISKQTHNIHRVVLDHVDVPYIDLNKK